MVIYIAERFSFNGRIIFSVGERKNSLPTLNIIQPKFVMDVAS